jgi:hypothetical protein
MDPRQLRGVGPEHVGQHVCEIVQQVQRSSLSLPPTKGEICSCVLAAMTALPPNNLSR